LLYGASRAGARAGAFVVALVCKNPVSRPAFILKAAAILIGSFLVVYGTIVAAGSSLDSASSARTSDGDALLRRRTISTERPEGYRRVDCGSTQLTACAVQQYGQLRRVDEQQ